MRIRIGVEENGSLESIHGVYHLVWKYMRLGALAVRRRDHKRRIRTDFARATLLHAASTAAMESVKVPS